MIYFEVQCDALPNFEHTIATSFFKTCFTSFAFVVVELCVLLMCFYFFVWFFFFFVSMRVVLKENHHGGDYNLFFIFFVSRTSLKGKYRQ